MRKLILGLVASVALVTSAQADWNGHRHHPRHHYNHGGGDAGAALFGGLVGGIIIGGMINQMNQPRYYNQAPVYYGEPICQEIVTARYWNGWRWVYRTQVVCE